ncbi:GILT-like protein 1 [Blattella germanica]|nr:GILT-like protein 1 [Blattella germanica]
MEQACALHVLSFNTTAKVEFINCVMSSGSPSKAGQRCANTLGIGYEPIETCLNSHKGSQLLAGFGNRTHNLKPGIKFVPTIVFNGIYSKHDREAYKHFRKVICRYIEGTKPPACSNLKETYKKKY